jgi:DNA-binding response OmpR family regulator
MKVLVIEDEKLIIDTISLCFLVDWPGTKVVSSGEGNKGIEMVKSESPDIVILDIGLPDIDGFTVLRRIRSFSNVPIIVLTVMTAENDLVRCLEWGADDFITKPFSKMELLARVKTKICRRLPLVETSPLVCGNLKYEPESNRYYYNDKEIELTLTEAVILYQLMKQSGKVVKHSTLIESIWGSDSTGSASSLKVHIHHLRDKLKVYSGNPDFIQTWSGIGYSLEI